MIEIRTVLILGAGASANAGYHVGPAFKAAICQLGTNKTFLDETGAFGHTNAAEFVDRFKFSAIKSPDRFLEDPRMKEYREVGKYCIAKVLMNLENLDNLFPAGNAGWYETLFERLDIESGRYDKNQLAVITYNYDRSLECALWKMIEAQNLGDNARIKELWDRRPIIVHVHGALDLFDPGQRGHRSYEQTVDPEKVSTAASQIQIIYEADPTTPAFEHARELIQSAERVIFLGFGFNRENVERLQVFNEPTQREKIEGTTFRMGDRDRAYVFNEVFGPGLNPRQLVGQRIDNYIYEKL